jgi:hypothetical protein
VTLDGCAEVFFYRYESLSHKPTARTAELEHVPLTRWGAEMMRSSLTIENGFDFSIHLYWYEESQDPKFNMIMHPGESVRMGTFIGHVFVARSFTEDQPKADDPIVDFFVVNENAYLLGPHNRLDTCEVEQTHTDDGKMVFAESQLSCDDMEGRVTEFCMHVWHSKRLGLNYVQPQLVRSYTPIGFELRRMPEATFSWLRKW